MAILDKLNDFDVTNIIKSISAYSTTDAISTMFLTNQAFLTMRLKLTNASIL